MYVNGLVGVNATASPSPGASWVLCAEKRSGKVLSLSTDHR